MEIQTISKGGTDPIYRICRNTEASADMADGDCVVFDVTTTAGRDPGADVVKSTAGAQLTAAGIVRGPIPNGQRGRVQVYGFHEAVSTTVAALAVGATITTDAVAKVVAGATADDPSARMGVCLVLGAANKAGIFLKCLG